MTRAIPTSGMRPAAPAGAATIRRNTKFGWRRDDGKLVRDEAEQAHIIELWEHQSATDADYSALVEFSARKGFVIARSTMQRIMADPDNRRAYTESQRERVKAKRLPTEKVMAAPGTVTPLAYDSVTRDVPVEIVRKFEDRSFIVSADRLPTELRTFALAAVGLPTNSGPDVEIKIEPMLEFSPNVTGDGDQPGSKFVGLNFTVTRPADVQ